MKFLEKDLEQIIFYATHEQLENRGLDIYESSFKKIRQLNIGNYGVADMVVFERGYYKDYERCEILGSYLIINVIELKRDEIGINAFIQALRYVKGIKEYLGKRGSKIKFYLKITLIGSKINTLNDFTYLADLISNTEFSIYESGGLVGVDFYTYKYDIDGISFKGEYGYNLKDDRFNIKKIKHEGKI